MDKERRLSDEVQGWGKIRGTHSTENGGRHRCDQTHEKRSRKIKGFNMFVNHKGKITFWCCSLFCLSLLKNPIFRSTKNCLFAHPAFLLPTRNVFLNTFGTQLWLFSVVYIKLHTFVQQPRTSWFFCWRNMTRTCFQWITDSVSRVNKESGKVVKILDIKCKNPIIKFFISKKYNRLLNICIVPARIFKIVKSTSVWIFIRFLASSSVWTL